MQTPTRSLLLLLPLLLALGACGGEETTVIAPELGLDGPATLTVAPGASLSHDFSLQRNESASGPVTLSITGLPEGVTASFDPATVSGDALTTTLRLEAQRSAPRGASLVTIRATGEEDLIAERSFALEVRGITVEGRLLSTYGDLPPYPTPIVVDGQRTVTDEAGRFTLHDVALPYELVVLGQYVAEVFQGATHPSPTIRGMMMDPWLRGHVVIQGTVTPVPGPGETVLVCADTGPGAMTPSCVPPSEEGHFEMPVYLGALDTTAEVRLVARRAIASTDGVPQFTGYAEETLTVGNDASIEASLELQDASSATVTLNPIPHPEATHTQPFQNWVSYGERLVPTPSSAEDPTLLSIPSGGVALVAATSVTPTHQFGTFHRVDGPEDADIAFPSTGPRLVSPAAEATIDPQTEFVISGGEEAVTSHIFMFDDGLLMVHAVGDRVTLPDLSRLDHRFAPASLGLWALFHVPGVGDIEAALEGPFGYSMLLGFQTGLSATVPAQSMSFVMPVEQRRFGRDVGPLSVPPSFQLLAQ